MSKYISDLSTSYQLDVDIIVIFQVNKNIILLVHKRLKMIIDLYAEYFVPCVPLQLSGRALVS